MKDFTKIMHDWQRMCNYHDKKYGTDCCVECPLNKFNCGAVWEMGKTTDWEDCANIIENWATVHPERKIPTWREFLTKVNLVEGKRVLIFDQEITTSQFQNKNVDILTNKADEEIPLKLAVALELVEEADEY